MNGSKKLSTIKILCDILTQVVKFSNIKRRKHGNKEEKYEEEKCDKGRQKAKVRGQDQGREEMQELRIG